MIMKNVAATFLVLGVEGRVLCYPATASALYFYLNWGLTGSPGLGSVLPRPPWSWGHGCACSRCGPLAHAPGTDGCTAAKCLVHSTQRPLRPHRGHRPHRQPRIQWPACSPVPSVDPGEPHPRGQRSTAHAPHRMLLGPRGTRLCRPMLGVHSWPSVCAKHTHGENRHSPDVWQPLPWRSL